MFTPQQARGQLVQDINDWTRPTQLHVHTFVSKTGLRKSAAARKWLFSTADSSTATAGPSRGLQHHGQRHRAARPAGEPLAALQEALSGQSSDDAPLRPWRQKPAHSPEEWRSI